MDKIIIRRILICLMMFLFYASEGLFASPFQNGDFEAGNFTGWKGAVVRWRLFLPHVNYVNPDTDSRFDIVSNVGPTNSEGAQITAKDSYFIAALYQNFTLDTLNGGNWDMDINFWIQWTPTNSNKDKVYALLVCSGISNILTSWPPMVNLLDGINSNDLLNGTWVSQDITSFAQTNGGKDVTLAFIVESSDHRKPDILQIDNISFNQHDPSPVPEPATIGLLVFGLTGLLGVRRCHYFE